MTFTYELQDIEAAAAFILEHTKHPVVLFYGEMGVGKTTLIKVLAKQLGVEDLTSSPTFSLVNEYEGSERTIYHFDMYRIEDEEEVLDMGIEEYFYGNALSFVEWPERIPNLIPEEHTEIRLSIKNDGKRFLEIIN